jgi:5-methyltetrahydrofolate--homocysteine methyltransferase
LKGLYPKIFDNPKYGQEARKLHEEALALLNKIEKENRVQPRGVMAFWPAQSDQEEIIIYKDESRSEELERFQFLRQQSGKGLCLADYVAYVGGPKDYLGAFVVTAGSEIEALAILTQALGDRIAEATAEMLHKKAREFWGYGKDENLTNEELIQEKYRGIRPAPGYPACPDHWDKTKIFKLLSAEEYTGARLTENLAMTPPSSVSGFYFSYAEAKYFNVGAIGQDQKAELARRRNWTMDQVERWI